MSLSEKSGQGPRVEVQGLFHSNSVPQVTFLIRFWIFPLKEDWLVSIRLSPLFLVNLHVEFGLTCARHFPYVYQLRCDPFVFTWWMILAFYDAFAEGAYLRLAWLLADSPILSCADNISNQWCTISRQFLRVRQFKRTRLFECWRVIHNYALSLLFHFKSWFAQKLNYPTFSSPVYKQFLPRNLNITFALIEFTCDVFCKIYR